MIGVLAIKRHIFKIATRASYDVDVGLRLGLTSMANAYGRKRLTHPNGPVVSLTTYGERVNRVHLTIESIARGQMRPSRLIMWVDDKAIFDNLPPGVRRLQKRGLEVKLCKNYGPHTKYYPYLEMVEETPLPLVTADDDLLYPRDWLKGLDQALKEFPGFVNCHRAHRIALNSEGLETYRVWRPVNSSEASFCNFATGVAGVIYPPQMQRALKSQAAAFLESCPNADDVWLHLWALRTGHKIRQISKKRFRLRYIPGTQGGGLCQKNVLQGENDAQVKATYRPSDIERLRDAHGELGAASSFDSRGQADPIG